MEFLEQCDIADEVSTHPLRHLLQGAEQASLIHSQMSTYFCSMSTELTSQRQHESEQSIYVKIILKSSQSTQSANEYHPPP